MTFNEKAFINCVQGSGLNYTPEVKRSRNNVTIKWAYQCLNDAGYYDGFIDFRLVIPLKHPDEYKIYIARHSQQKEKEYQVKEYLEDTFYFAINEQLNNKGDYNNVAN